MRVAVMYPVRPERLIQPEDVEVTTPLVDQLFQATLISELTDALARVANGFNLDTEDRLLLVKARAFLAKLG